MIATTPSRRRDGGFAPRRSSGVALSNAINRIACKTTDAASAKKFRLLGEHLIVGGVLCSSFLLASAPEIWIPALERGA